MYQHDIPKLPTPITRNSYVDLVFDIGLEYSHGYDTIVMSVEIGDAFVLYKGNRSPFIPTAHTNFEIMNQLVPQEYSIELAHITTVTVAKFNETGGYQSTRNAISNTENCYIAKMEFEIFEVIDFHINRSNFITVFGNLLPHTNQKHLGSVFWDLSKAICLDYTLMQMNPYTLILGTILLNKHGKLKAVSDNKYRMFQTLLTHIVEEYELTYSDVIHAYKQVKS